MMKNILLLFSALLLINGSLGCVNDSDCGTVDQEGYCDVGSGVCQCGVGFEGDTAIDPSICSSVCVPPSVPDAVVFLVEPIIGMEANGGNLELSVDLDVYSKQIPTTMAFINPDDLTSCDLMPGTLGSGTLTQSVDGASCDTSYLYSNNFATEVNQGCWETLASTSESGPQYDVTFNSYRTRVEVIQEGLAPFGQSASSRSLGLEARQDETSIARLFRRDYTISVATRFSLTNEPFLVLAGGEIKYRLVEIDYDLANSVIRVTVETQTSDASKLENVLFDAGASSGLASVATLPSVGDCDAGSEPGFCNQFHVMEFDADPCIIESGEIVLSVELVCADGSDPATCGFTNLPAGNIFTLDNLFVDYDACPRVITYGVDAANSFLRLHEDVPRNNILSAPAVTDNTYYGLLSIEPAGDATFQSVTLNSLSVYQVASPNNIDLGDQLGSTFITLLSPVTSNDALNPIWNFDLSIDGSFFTQAETYYLEASLDLVFTNTGPLTRTLRIPLGKNSLISHALREDDEERVEDGVASSTFRMQAVVDEEEPQPSSSNTAAIVGGVFAACLAVVGIVLIVVLLKRRNKDTKQQVLPLETVTSSEESV